MATMVTPTRLNVTFIRTLSVLLFQLTRPLVCTCVYCMYGMSRFWLLITRGEFSYLAPLGSEKFPPLISSSVSFGGGVEGITPQTESNTTPPSPKTEVTNILFYILNLWLRIYCSGLRGCDTREKEIVIWPCWCFHGRYYFYSLKFTLMFINARKRNANTYLISSFDSLEAAPSNLPP